MASSGRVANSPQGDINRRLPLPLPLPLPLLLLLLLLRRTQLYKTLSDLSIVNDQVHYQHR